MNSPRILFAHERPSVRRVVEQALRRDGFQVEAVADVDSARNRLSAQSWDGFVVDVGLPGIPGYEFFNEAKEHGDVGAKIVILVASVYRKTSYKRRPSRLYGADDYVEIHHLCDQLPAKLRHHLGLPGVIAPIGESELEEELRAEGDARLENHESDRLAQLIVADMVLYNGERILSSQDLAAARRAVEGDLEIARELFNQLYHGTRADVVQRDPVDQAFSRLMRALGRTGKSEDG